jgi:hypothetical protein
MNTTTMGFPNPILVGNVLSIPPGDYSAIYMTEKNISGPLIIDAKGATFSGKIYLPPRLKDVDFINFTFTNVVGECFRWSNNQVATGLSNVRFLDCTASNCGAFCFIGTAIKNGLSMSEKVEIGNITITGDRKQPPIVLFKSENAYVHDIVLNREPWDYAAAGDFLPAALVLPAQIIYYPNNYILLEPPADITWDKVISHLWEKIAGPPCMVIKIPDLKGCALAKDMAVEGTYQFQLTVMYQKNVSQVNSKLIQVKTLPTITGILYSDGTTKAI